MYVCVSKSMFPYYSSHCLNYLNKVLKHKTEFGLILIFEMVNHLVEKSENYTSR